MLVRSTAKDVNMNLRSGRRDARARITWARSDEIDQAVAGDDQGVFGVPTAESHEWDRSERPYSSCVARYTKKEGY